jgi:hypothetical protein
MSYGANFEDMFRHTAEVVDKILRGTKQSPASRRSKSRAPRPGGTTSGSSRRRCATTLASSAAIEISTHPRPCSRSATPGSRSPPASGRSAASGAMRPITAAASGPFSASNARSSCGWSCTPGVGWPLYMREVDLLAAGVHDQEQMSLSAGALAIEVICAYTPPTTDLPSSATYPKERIQCSSGRPRCPSTK